jgi:hypothetical protein
MFVVGYQRPQDEAAEDILEHKIEFIPLVIKSEPGTLGTGSSNSTVWCPSVSQTPMLGSELASCERSGDAPHLHASNFFVLLCRDLDSIFNMQLMQVSFDEERVEDPSKLLQTFTPIPAVLIDPFVTDSGDSCRSRASSMNPHSNLQARERERARHTNRNKCQPTDGSCQAEQYAARTRRAGPTVHI